MPQQTNPLPPTLHLSISTQDSMQIIFHCYCAGIESHILFVCGLCVFLFACLYVFFFFWGGGKCHFFLILYSVKDTKIHRMNGGECVVMTTQNYIIEAFLF